MKHVLITGGAGFIGSYLSERFLREGYAVTAVDNLCTGRKSNLKSALEQDSYFDFVEWDVSRPIDETRLKLFKKHGLEGVLHFACPASPVDFARIPFEILAVDSLGTMNTVDLALRNGARYVLASTSEIYGDPLVHPQEESYFGNVNTVGPRACYDEAKRFAEAYVSTAVRGDSKTLEGNRGPLNGGIARIFNTYGPRMRPDDGRIVPELCMQAIQHRPLTVHGDGKQTRSFCFVSDLVDGIVRLYESEVKEPVNLGNPVEKTVIELAQILLKISSSRSRIEFLAPRPDDPKRRCPDITRAKRLLGWFPKIDLEDGLKQSLEYFRDMP